MSLSGLKTYFLTQLILISEWLKNQLSTLDQHTLEQILIVGLLALGFFLFLGFVLLVMSLFRRGRDVPADSFQVSSDLSVLVRDLNTRVSNLSTQARDEHLYLKQELAELRTLLEQAKAHAAEAHSHRLPVDEMTLRRTPMDLTALKDMR